jgi:hypothetical protein
MAPGKEVQRETKCEGKRPELRRKEENLRKNTKLHTRFLFPSP